MINMLINCIFSACVSRSAHMYNHFQREQFNPGETATEPSLAGVMNHTVNYYATGQNCVAIYVAIYLVQR